MEHPVDDGTRPLDLRAYLIDGAAPMPIVPAAHDREWMSSTPVHFAMRCLPLLIANQAGWTLLNTRPIEVVWNGGDRPSDLQTNYLDRASDSGHSGSDHSVASHFGSGIVTWQIPYLFRTPPGYDLWVRGPANAPKDGVSPLEGIVEADWTVASFTMSWKVTRPSWPVRFEEDEPLAMILPVRRHELETFRTTYARLSDVPDLEAGYMRWANSRERFNLGRLESTPLPQWQKDYFRGRPLAGEAPPDHRTRLDLDRFELETLHVAPFGLDLDEPR